MRTLLCVASILGWGLAATVKAEDAEMSAASPWFYQMAPITNIGPGNLGNTRIYFDEACNQTFIQTLTQGIDGHTFAAGILTRVSTSGCNRPSRSSFGTVRAHGADVVAVGHFDHVWDCQMSCTVYNGGQPPVTYRLQGFGTSQDQAMETMYCNGYSSNLLCSEIHVRDAQ